MLTAVAGEEVVGDVLEEQRAEMTPSGRSLETSTAAPTAKRKRKRKMVQAVEAPAPVPGFGTGLQTGLYGIVALGLAAAVFLAIQQLRRTPVSSKVKQVSALTSHEWGAVIAELAATVGVNADYGCTALTDSTDELRRCMHE